MVRWHNGGSGSTWWIVGWQQMLSCHGAWWGWVMCLLQIASQHLKLPSICLCLYQPLWYLFYSTIEVGLSLENILAISIPTEILFEIDVRI